MNIIIRNEEESDIEAILQITKAAFQDQPYSHQTEQFIINALTESNLQDTPSKATNQALLAAICSS